MNLRAAAQQALEALVAIEEDPHGSHSFPALANDAITALRAALSEPEQTEWDVVPDEFNAWWDGYLDDRKNPYREDSPIYWAWEGWKAAMKQRPEPEQERPTMEQMLALADENQRLRAELKFGSTEPEHDTDCHEQGICQRSGYSIKPPPQVEVLAYGQVPPSNEPGRVWLAYSAAKCYRWVGGAWVETVQMGSADHAPQRTESVQEPVAWRYWHSSGGGTESEYVYIGREFPAWRNPLREPVPLYTHPAPQPVELTDEEIWKIYDDTPSDKAKPFIMQVVRAVIEAYQRKQEGRV